MSGIPGIPFTPEQTKKFNDDRENALNKRVADKEEERRKRLEIRTVGTCRHMIMYAVCGGDILLTPNEVHIGEWRSGPMPTKMEYVCACIKCGAAYNPQHFLDKEKPSAP